MIGPGLAPAATVTCTTTYTVTAADVASGQLRNTAAASAFYLQDYPDVATVSATSNNRRPSPQTTRRSKVSKSGTISPASSNGRANVGDTIAYTYIVTNTGNQILASVAVTDPTLGPVTCPTPPAPGLAVGGTLTCTADVTYTVTAADLALGYATDTATATGTDVLGTVSPVSNPSTVTIPVGPNLSTTISSTTGQPGTLLTDSIHINPGRPGGFGGGLT